METVSFVIRHTFTQSNLPGKFCNATRLNFRGRNSLRNIPWKPLHKKQLDVLGETFRSFWKNIEKC